MARPAKSAKVLTDKSQTKAEIAARIDFENKLGGGDDSIKPPKHLTAVQKKIFRNVVALLKPSGVLQNTDVDIIAEYAFTLERKNAVETLLSESPADKDLMTAYNTYSKNFFRCCNELSLSPQSRAKIANAAMQASDGTAELLEILRG